MLSINFGFHSDISSLCIQYCGVSNSYGQIINTNGKDTTTTDSTRDCSFLFSPPPGFTQVEYLFFFRNGNGSDFSHSNFSQSNQGAQGFIFESGDDYRICLASYNNIAENTLYCAYMTSAGVYCVNIDRNNFIKLKPSAEDRYLIESYNPTFLTNCVLMNNEFKLLGELEGAENCFSFEDLFTSTDKLTVVNGQPDTYQINTPMCPKTCFFSSYELFNCVELSVLQLMFEDS